MCVRRGTGARRGGERGGNGQSGRTGERAAETGGGKRRKRETESSDVGMGGTVRPFPRRGDAGRGGRTKPRKSTGGRAARKRARGGGTAGNAENHFLRVSECFSLWAARARRRAGLLSGGTRDSGRRERERAAGASGQTNGAAGTCARRGHGGGRPFHQTAWV